MIQIPTSSSIELAIDTNVAIEFLNDAAGASARVGSGVRVAIPIFALGELFAGAKQSQRVSQNWARVEDLARRVRVLGSDLETARQFGLIRADLKIKGTMIPEDDMWIAAVALQHRLPLLTRDKHFHVVDGLQIVSW